MARALDGLTGGNVSVANAYLADVTPEDERQRSFGRMAVAGNLGFHSRAGVGGGCSGRPRRVKIPVVMAAALISCIAAVLIARYLPESRPCALQRSPETNSVRKVFGQEQRDCYRLEKTRRHRAAPDSRAPLCAVPADAQLPDLSCLQLLLHGVSDARDSGSGLVGKRDR